MDRARFSLVGHDGILLWNPLPEDETLATVDSIDVHTDARVLDVGCGRAALLIRLLERTGASGVGIDRVAEALAQARGDAAGRVAPSRLGLREEDFDAGRLDDGSFDVAFCVGSTHAVGGCLPALRALHSLLVPGGTAVVGEGHWMREPDPEYLAFLGDTRDALLDHAGNAAAARDAGFDVVRKFVTSPRDFDRYEDRYAANVERFVAEHPDDPDADAFRTTIRAWRAAYMRWGRETLGFALYVLRRR